MSAYVKPPRSGRKARQVKTKPKKYGIDIIFPTGQKRNCGRFNYLSHARDRYQELVRTASIADRITATRLSDGFTFGHRRGTVGYC